MPGQRANVRATRPTVWAVLKAPWALLQTWWEALAGQAAENRRGSSHTQWPPLEEGSLRSSRWGLASGLFLMYCPGKRLIAFCFVLREMNCSAEDPWGP